MECKPLKHSLSPTQGRSAFRRRPDTQWLPTGFLEIWGLASGLLCDARAFPKIHILRSRSSSRSVFGTNRGIPSQLGSVAGLRFDSIPTPTFPVIHGARRPREAKIPHCPPVRAVQMSIATMQSSLVSSRLMQDGRDAGLVILSG